MSNLLVTASISGLIFSPRTLRRQTLWCAPRYGWLVAWRVGRRLLPLQDTFAQWPLEGIFAQWPLEGHTVDDRSDRWRPIRPCCCRVRTHFCLPCACQCRMSKVSEGVTTGHVELSDRRRPSAFAGGMLGMGFKKKGSAVVEAWHCVASESSRPRVQTVHATPASRASAERGSLFFLAVGARRRRSPTAGPDLRRGFEKISIAFVRLLRIGRASIGKKEGPRLVRSSRSVLCDGMCETSEDKS